MSPDKPDFLNPQGVQEDLTEIKQIASGGMSIIYKAYQPQLDRYVVLKKLKPIYKDNPEVLQRFKREAKSMGTVLHQNVAHVYQFVEAGPESYILMEYIDGIDLSAAIHKLGSLPVDVATMIALGIAQGLDEIHSHHLIHRDIKPANIRLTSRGEVKLMDFGIILDTEEIALTRPGIMVGSPSYLSPEQILGESVTTKSDIFLTGICLYEMLAGTRPFHEDAGATLFHNIRIGKYVPLRQMNSTIPRKLEKIVDKCLSNKPEQRYASAHDLIADLEKFIGNRLSKRKEDRIIEFLDKEALVIPTVEYEAPKKAEHPIKKWICLETIILGGLILSTLAYLLLN